MGSESRCSEKLRLKSAPGAFNYRPRAVVASHAHSLRAGLFEDAASASAAGETAPHIPFPGRNFPVIWLCTRVSPAASPLALSSSHGASSHGAVHFQLNRGPCRRHSTTHRLALISSPIGADFLFIDEQEERDCALLDEGSI